MNTPVKGGNPPSLKYWSGKPRVRFETRSQSINTSFLVDILDSFRCVRTERSYLRRSPTDRTGRGSGSFPGLLLVSCGSWILRTGSAAKLR